MPPPGYRPPPVVAPRAKKPFPRALIFVLVGVLILCCAGAGLGSWAAFGDGAATMASWFESDPEYPQQHQALNPIAPGGGTYTAFPTRADEFYGFCGAVSAEPFRATIPILVGSTDNDNEDQDPKTYGCEISLGNLRDHATTGAEGSLDVHAEIHSTPEAATASYQKQDLRGTPLSTDGLAVTATLTDQSDVGIAAVDLAAVDGNLMITMKVSLEYADAAESPHIPIEVLRAALADSLNAFLITNAP